MVTILTGLLVGSFMFILQSAQGASQPATEAIAEAIAEDGLQPARIRATIPVTYKTGKWITTTIGGVLMENNDLLLAGEPQVTFNGQWTFNISFTTAISVPAVTVYYGVYDADDPLLPWPRYRFSQKENLTGQDKQHSVDIDLNNFFNNVLNSAPDMEDNGGGLIAYRLEIFNATVEIAGFPGYSTNEPFPGQRIEEDISAANSATRFYDRRFEFYNGQRVPTVIEGPFVDQISANGATVSWETDLPVTGTVVVEGVGYP